MYRQAPAPDTSPNRVDGASRRQAARAASVGNGARRVQQRGSRSGLALLAVAAALLSGCGSLDYYSHLLAGQYRIWQAREPIDRVLAAGALPPETARRLGLAARARDYAFRELALPDNGSFRDYVDLGREYVIWNVFATPKLSLEPLESCHLFVGCFSYRGFFDARRAAEYAERLRAAGNDVFVGGVAAYSTLGWLDDPVLSSMLNRDDAGIVEVVFHELAHERLYVPGDTAFNESFAMSVAQAGLARWLPLNGLDPADAARARERHEAFVELLMEARGTLAGRFAAAADDEARRRVKAETFAELRAAYATLRTAWDGDDTYDAWMSTDLNNAKLASVSTYHVHSDAFTELLRLYDGDFTGFYRAVERLGALPPGERSTCLSALDPATGSPGAACAVAAP